MTAIVMGSKSKFFLDYFYALEEVFMIISGVLLAWILAFRW